MTDDLFTTPPGQESIRDAFDRLGIGPGDHVTADQYPHLPDWFRDRQAEHAQAIIDSREANDPEASL
jgi:hypothetical protein